ncbi:hypothetical protein N431DRAFT_560478 [Stipitochalara longipes BDJ]|nr:hypothetical protein N431DRAFT_560478 [Stipitochalara longipes BDJ]
MEYGLSINYDSSDESLGPSEEIFHVRRDYDYFRRQEQNFNRGEERHRDGFDIFIDPGGLETFPLRVRPDDSVRELRAWIASRLGAAPEQIRLVYLDFELNDHDTLGHYSITPGHTIVASLLTPRPPFASHPNYQSGVSGHPHTLPSYAAGPARSHRPAPAVPLHFEDARRPIIPLRDDQPLLDIDETRMRIEYWRAQGQYGNFDPDFEIVDPEAHYSHLEHLERNIIQDSEFLRCGGSYNLGDNACINDLSGHPQLHDIPDEIWHETITRLSLNLDRTEWFSGRGHEVDEEGPTSFVLSLRKSFILLRTILAKIENLRNSGFSTDFLSVLADRGENVAELSKIPFQLLNRLFDDMYDAFMQISHIGNTSWDEITPILEHNVRISCTNLLMCAQITGPALKNQSLAQILDLCRSTILFLDLALVSYVGCHASRFNSYLNPGAEEIRIPIFDNQVVVCNRRRLACLDSFLKEVVWVFQPPGVRLLNTRIGGGGHGLSILCQMEVFADVWGPVWSVTDQEGKVLQHNLSTGCIRQTAPFHSGQVAVTCHWFDVQHATRISQAVEQNLLGMNDYLVIGGRLRENDQCLYTIKHYESDFSHTGYMNPLSTSEEQWRWENRGMNGSVGFGGATAGASFGQKKFPAVTQRDATWNKWNLNPETGNIGFLNNFHGVEISHCTGHARRIRTNDLLRVSSVREYLNELFPTWETDEYGSRFLQALQSNDPRRIYDFWRENPNFRRDIGKVLCQLLELLHDTGSRAQDDHFKAAYLRKYSPNRQMEIPLKGNEWARRLRDSRNSASYVVITDTCLKCISDGKEMRNCKQNRLTRTIYQTRIQTDSNVPQNLAYIQLDHKGEYFRVQRISKRNRQFILSASAIPQIYRLECTKAWREFLNPGPDGDNTRNREWEVLVVAATKSFGGMKKPMRQQIGSLLNEGQEPDQSRNRKRQKEPGCCVIL